MVTDAVPGSDVLLRDGDGVTSCDTLQSTGEHEHCAAAVGTPAMNNAPSIDIPSQIACSRGACGGLTQLFMSESCRPVGYLPVA